MVTTSRTFNSIVGFSHRLAWAIIFGLAGFFPCVIPSVDYGPYRTIFHAICYTFNLPVALVTRLDIPYLVGLDVFWFRGVGEFMPLHEMLVWHMRVAVPLYLFLLYLPTWIFRGARHWRRKGRVLAV